MKLRMSILTAICLEMIFTGSAYASEITKIDVVPQGNKTTIVLSYQGEAEFRSLLNEKTSSLVIEGSNLNLPAILTRTIDLAKKNGPILQITPYNSMVGTKQTAKLVVQLRGRVDYSKSESAGHYILEIQEKSGSTGLPLEAKQNINSKTDNQANGIRKEWYEGSDTIRSESAANEKSEEIAKKLVEVLDSAAESKKYFGSRVAFEGVGADVHDIFRLVGEASGLNIVSDSDLTFKATYSLKDIPWDQFLDLVIQQASLKAFAVGNVIRVTTMANYTKTQEEKRKELMLGNQLEPIVMAVVPISFAKAEDMKKMIEDLLVKGDTNNKAAQDQLLNKAIAPGGAVPAAAIPPGGAVAPGMPGGIPGQQGMSSMLDSLAQAFVRGKVEVDSRTNSLIITNTKLTIERIRRLIKELDLPIPQVLIDAKIVIGSETFTRSISLGYNMRATTPGIGSDSGKAGGGLGFNFPNTTAIGGGPAYNAGFPLPASNSNNNGSFNIGMAFGSGQHGSINTLLQLSEVEGNSKTVASPRVIVNNKTKATISDGKKILVTTPGSANSAPTQDFKDVKMTFDVTPQITNAGSVLLNISLNKDDLTSTSGEIATKQIETEVLVDSGSTLVLGGVYSFDVLKSTSGIPFLRNLPFLGPLFRADAEVMNKSELMIFITPQIIEATLKAPAGDEMPAKAQM